MEDLCDIILLIVDNPKKFLLEDAVSANDVVPKNAPAPTLSGIPIFVIM